MNQKEEMEIQASELSEWVRLQMALKTWEEMNSSCSSSTTKMLSLRLNQKLDLWKKKYKHEHHPNDAQVMKRKGRKNGRGFDVAMSFLQDVMLFFFACTVLVTHLLSLYYRNYITPTIQAARWNGPNHEIDRLKQEFTYYNRPCDEFDVTQSDLQGLIFSHSNSSSSTTKATTLHDAMDTIMTHGMGIFPSLIQSQTASILRSYILKRNKELTADEYIPLDTPQNRWSFGIHANEHPSVAKALMELSHDALLTQTLEGLLGKDPAVVEITAISVAPGAGAQGWHPDVKPLGSSVKYAQTFTHSYSLFIPLQDVTPRMGATEVCPGTHFCASEELHAACVARGFQAAQDDVPWKTGNGLLMNQKMWHRGAAYLGKTGETRVVFIVTFTSRPNFGKDHRQLSHGTYFHIHPHMYGHTLNDLKHASTIMKSPFSILRSLGLWKPAHAHWGYPWWLNTALRIATQQNGYQFEDLEMFLQHYSLAKRIPSFLHGRAIDDGYGGWGLYLGETIENFKWVARGIYLVFFLLLWLFWLVKDAMLGDSAHRVYKFLKKSVLINILVLCLGYQWHTSFRRSQFAKAVEQQAIYARPFRLDNKHDMNQSLLSLPFGPSTLPERKDVLFGMRHFSNYNGFYRNFLDYHPGNIFWRKMIQDHSDTFHAFQGIDQQRVVDMVLSNIQSVGGRLLQQGEDGRWMVMNNDDRKEFAINALKIGRSTVLNKLERQIKIELTSINNNLFLRNKQSMKEASIRYVHSLYNVLFSREESKKGEPTASNDVQRRSTVFGKIHSFLPILPKQVDINIHSETLQPIRVRPDFYLQVGDLFLSNFRGSGYYLPGRITETMYEKYGTIEYLTEDGQYIKGEVEESSIVLSSLRPYRQIQQGDKVAVIYSDCDNCPLQFLPATITNMHPDSTCDVKYSDNGQMDFDLSVYHVALKLEDDFN